MYRGALAAFFRRQLIATLPLGLLAGCSDGYGSIACPGGNFSFAIPIDGGVDHVFTTEECARMCGIDGGLGFPYLGCRLVELDMGPALLCGQSCPVAGRRPATLAPAPEPAGGGVVGRYFASMARLEAASVPAFETLQAELAAHGAPARLVAAARAAAVDEARHARLTGALARRFGAAVAPPQVAPMGVRPLEEVARENAVEGCVRETFGALVAAWQAELAGDRAVRRALGSIAPDEARHAELALEVRRWATPRLAPPARRSVEDAHEAAVRQLAAELAVEPPAELRRLAGVPTAPKALELLSRLTPLWSSL
jgi:hypothetical protein